MPKTHYTDSVNAMKKAEQQAKRDRIREIINGAYKDQGQPIQEVCRALGVQKSAAYRRLNQPGGKWELGELIATADCLHIPMNELTPFMTSQYYGRAQQNATPTKLPKRQFRSDKKRPPA